MSDDELASPLPSDTSLQICRTPPVRMPNRSRKSAAAFSDFFLLAGKTYRRSESRNRQNRAVELSVIGSVIRKSSPDAGSRP
ncbi:hypothetical protein DP43_4541 [Burkholderia pseudomallei]|nr:hypothetical protein DP43_4541 [Burkholderia pseudomallei]